jgi:hypothetical protein
MKPIEALIAARLADYAALKAIHNGQCQQGVARQEWQPPYQTVFLISDPPEMKRIGIPSPRLQINNFSPNYGQSRLMAELTYEALDGVSGVLDGVSVVMGSYEDMNIIYESETGFWNCPVDVKITYRR